MKREFEFNYYLESEYPDNNGYFTKKKERIFHCEEHFVVPWELAHDESKDSAKVWE